MIASPSDVTEQRDIVRSIIGDWNYANSLTRRVMLMPVGWETHAAPDLSGRAQDLINERLLKDCDLLVGIFWTRLGTPTGTFSSGTVEEITRHVESGKPAMIYFSDAPVAPQSLDADQFSKLLQFKAWCFERGLVATFTNSPEFRTIFRNQLDLQLNTQPYLRGILANSGEEDSRVAVPELSDDAKQLLSVSAADSYGMIILSRTIGGDTIDVGERSFGEYGNARESARWEAALQELAELGYVTSRGEETFQVSHNGYQRADQLRNETK